MAGIEFESAAIMVPGAFEFRSLLGLQGRGQQIMIASVVGLMPQRRRQVAACLLVLAAFEVDFRQPRLGLLGGFGGQRAETRQPCEDCQRVAMTADFLIAPSHGENAIDEIQS
jgi:hypothetical protein